MSWTHTAGFILIKGVAEGWGGFIEVFRGSPNKRERFSFIIYPVATLGGTL